MATRLTTTAKQISNQTLSISDISRVIDQGFIGGIIFDPGLVSATPGGTGTATGGASSGQATASAGTSANLQVLLAAIPVAVDGQVITAEHHNSLRAAIITLANQLGVGLTSPTTTYTYAPSLLPIAGAPANWSVTNNFIAQGAVASNPDGWLPVQLPQGQMIKQMTVTGKLTTPAPASFTVTLFREPVESAAGTVPTALITIALQTKSGSFSESAAVTAGSAPANSAAAVVQQITAQDLKLIDTENYKYFVRATVTGAGTAGQAEIDAVQIVVGS